MTGIDRSFSNWQYLSLRYNNCVKQKQSQQNQTSTRVLNWIFALALILVVCAIGSVAWNCIDSLQKHSERLQTYAAGGKDTSFTTKGSNLQRELDDRINSNQMDPMAAIQAPSAHGSEVPFARGVAAMGKHKFVEAATDFSQALSLIPMEASSKQSWHIGEVLVDRRLYMASAYEQRGCCYMATGQYPLAASDLTVAIRMRPDYVNNYKNRAKVYDLLGKKGLAAADIKTIQALSRRAPK
jgi:tetratricopeptide (TPR) repeat protein